MGIRKYNLGTDIPASEFSAVFLLTTFVQFLDNGRSCEVFTLKAVFGFSFLADLYHSYIVAFDMSGTDETYYLGACIPAVCQYIAETDFMLDGSSDHLDSEVNLVYGVLFKTLLDGSILVSFCTVSPGEFLFAHPIVAPPSFLPENGKVEKHLADAIGNAEEESLEAKNVAMLKVRMDASDALHTSASLMEVRIINHQTGIRRLMVTSDDDSGPKLTGNMIHQLAPVGTAIVEKLIEHIFMTTKFAA